MSLDREFEQATYLQRQAAPPVGTGGAGMLAVQRMAGNKAARTLARKPLTKREQELVDIGTDYSDAKDHIQDHFRYAAQLLELEDKIRERAIENFGRISGLKDPPTLSEALVASLWSQVLGAIPGGAAIKFGITAGIFALDAHRLAKEIGPTSAERMRAKGPSEEYKKAGEKVFGAGKKGYDHTKQTIDDLREAKEKQEKAAADEAEVLQMASWHKGRITDWARAVTAAREQEAKIKGWVEKAHKAGTHRGKLTAAVQRDLVFPDVPTAQIQSKLEAAYELAMYREKFSDRFWVEKRNKRGELWHQGMEGAAISGAIKRRVMQLASLNPQATSDRDIAQILWVTTKLVQEEKPQPYTGPRYRR